MLFVVRHLAGLYETNQADAALALLGVLERPLGAVFRPSSPPSHDAELVDGKKDVCAALKPSIPLTQIRAFMN